MHPSFLVSVLFSQKSPEHSRKSKLSRQFYAYLKRCSVFILFASHKLPKAKSHEIICHIISTAKAKPCYYSSYAWVMDVDAGICTYLLAEASSELNLRFYVNPRTLTHLIQLVNAICIHHALACMAWLSITLTSLSFSFFMTKIIKLNFNHNPEYSLLTYSLGWLNQWS